MFVPSGPRHCDWTARLHTSRTSLRLDPTYTTLLSRKPACLRHRFSQMQTRAMSVPTPTRIRTPATLPSRLRLAAPALDWLVPSALTLKSTDYAQRATPCAARTAPLIQKSRIGQLASPDVCKSRPARKQRVTYSSIVRPAPRAPISLISAPLEHTRHGQPGHSCATTPHVSSLRRSLHSWHIHSLRAEMYFPNNAN
jgi:hypothetical protein